TYTWNTMVPKNSIRHIEALANTLIENNVQAIQINLKPRFFGLEGGNVYVFRRMLNEPGAKSADALLSEYIEACYMEASGIMEQFFRRLNQRLDFIHEAADYARHNRNGFLTYTTIYTPDLINTLSDLLDQAEKTVVSPGAQYRLAATRIEFDYLKHNVNIIYHYYSYRLRPDDAGLERLLSAIDERNAWLEELDKNRRSRPTYRYLRIDQLKGSSEPFNWDTAKIRSGELPGAIKPTDPAFAIRAAGTVTLQDKAWDNAPAYQLQPNRGEKELKETTTFQLLYDKDNLYVRFDGGMQSELMDTFQPRGRDGELWLQECVNILLAPEGDKSQYYYLTYEPVADSFIDANHGYITDPLHPKFGWNDQTWDGDWTYVNELLPDRNRWLSMAVIPFSTLKAPTPKPGAVWAGNFGRVHFKEIPTSTKHGDRVKARESSVWLTGAAAN
ncbi:MAG: carbohydrate-binding family 9-like protein, partial [Lentisphaerae bacterium]|nr:carbohydrate-binding family 9-like protein [Lentisphaerota bacterium]